MQQKIEHQMQLQRTRMQHTTLSGFLSLRRLFEADTIRKTYWNRYRSYCSRLKLRRWNETRKKKEKKIIRGNISSLTFWLSVFFRFFFNLSIVPGDRSIVRRQLDRSQAIVHLRPSLNPTARTVTIRRENLHVREQVVLDWSSVPYIGDHLAISSENAFNVSVTRPRVRTHVRRDSHAFTST